MPRGELQLKGRGHLELALARPREAPITSDPWPASLAEELAPPTVANW